MLETILNALNEKKGEDIIAIDISKSSPLCDYFVICSGQHDRQLLALAQAVEEELSKKGYNIKKLKGKVQNG